MISTTKLVFIALLSALLHGCAPVDSSYAPVTVTVPVSAHYPAIAKDEIKYHLVKKNETLYAISQLFNLDYHKLAQWNQIAPPYRLYVGRKICVSDPRRGEVEPGAVADDSKDGGGRATQGAVAETKQLITATTANKVTAQQKVAILLNILPVQPPNKNLPIHNAVEKVRNSEQKKSIISTDNKSMLKLNFRWPIKGKVLKAFSKVDNKGIDIAGEMGQAVSAAEAGKVVYSGQGLIGYGQLLIIKHNDIYLSAYANNSQLLVAEGYSVEKGQVIAKMGLAGSNKTSLHFEIRKHGKPVNPLNFLPEKH